MGAAKRVQGGALAPFGFFKKVKIKKIDWYYTVY